MSHSSTSWEKFFRIVSPHTASISKLCCSVKPPAWRPMSISPAPEKDVLVRIDDIRRRYYPGMPYAASKESCLSPALAEGLFTTVQIRCHLDIQMSDRRTPACECDHSDRRAVQR